MGQKINANTFRLNNLKNSTNSSWYTIMPKYSAVLNDILLLKNKLNSHLIKFSNLSKIYTEIYIFGDSIYTNVLIEMLHPREKYIKNFFKISQKTLETRSLKLIFLQKIKNILSTYILNSNKPLNIKLKFIKSIYYSPSLISNHISTLLKKRIPYKRIFSEIINNVPKNVIKGIKIELSGRLNGSEMAKTETISKGLMPLQSKISDIDYFQGCSTTIYGNVGIKVWIYK